MRRILIASLLTLACVGAASAQAGRGAPGPVRRELLRLVRADPLLWEEIAGQGYPGEEASAVADAVLKNARVEEIDAQGDGRPEYVVVLEAAPVCGTLGNCPHRVYGASGRHKYRLLLQAAGRGIVVQKRSSRGYRDLTVDFGNTAEEGGFVTYRYDGRRYRAHECVLERIAERGEGVTRTKCGG